MKCLHCGTEFTPRRTWQKFCCHQHQVDFNNQLLREAVTMARKRAIKFFEQEGLTPTGRKPKEPNIQTTIPKTPEVHRIKKALRRRLSCTGE